MKLIKPSYEIWEQTISSWKVDGEDTPSNYFNAIINGIYKQVERAGRICYKSEDKITKDSAPKFVKRLVDSQHYAMLEHGTVYLKSNYHDVSFETLYMKYAMNKYSQVRTDSELLDEKKNVYITTNLRVIIENNWQHDLEYICAPTEFHAKRVTVHFTCNRQVSHEFVRHRVFSFAQESTRYCNYCKGKFGNGLTFIDPCWEDASGKNLKCCLEYIESAYNALIQQGWKPQQAATILPNATKTELVMTGFVSDWKHFFDLRALGTTGAPHPQAKELAEPLMNEFKQLKLID